MRTIESLETYVNNVGRTFPYDTTIAKNLLDKTSELISCLTGIQQELSCIIQQNEKIVKQNITLAVEHLPDSASELPDEPD